jgi:hypothetical protein
MVINFTVDSEYNLTVLADEGLGTGILPHNGSISIIE